MSRGQSDDLVLGGLDVVVVVPEEASLVPLRLHYPTLGGFGIFLCWS